MTSFTFRGLMAPVFTAFKQDLCINLEIIPKYATHLSKAGIKGILVNGTTGEGMSLNVEERKKSTEKWVEVVKTTKQHLMVQVGGAPLPDVLELARHAEQTGVNSILCLPDLYMKPSTSLDLIRYLSIVSKAAPRTPLLYYHIPKNTNVNIHMGKFLNDISNQIPTFHGIKFTSTLLDEGIDALRAQDGKFAVFLGPHTIMAGAFALGFNSAISTSLNMFPEYANSILNNISEGNLLEATKQQNKLNDTIDEITKNGSWVSTMKTAMNLIQPINCGNVREPLVQLTKNETNEIKLGLENNLNIKKMY